MKTCGFLVGVYFKIRIYSFHQLSHICELEPAWGAKNSIRNVYEFPIIIDICYCFPINIQFDNKLTDILLSGVLDQKSHIKHVQNLLLNSHSFWHHFESIVTFGLILTAIRPCKSQKFAFFKNCDYFLHSKSVTISKINKL